MKKRLTLIISITILVIIATVLVIININNQSNQDENSPVNNTTNNNSNEPIENNNMEGDANMNIIINGETLTATLENNATTAALLEMLPLEISMSELNGNEKYNYLSESLPTNSENIGTIHAGDIMLYGDDCLVIFYETFNTSYHYTKIGHIDYDNLRDLLGNGNVTVRINK